MAFWLMRLWAAAVLALSVHGSSDPALQTPKNLASTSYKLTRSPTPPHYTGKRVHDNSSSSPLISRHHHHHHHKHHHYNTKKKGEVGKLPHVMPSQPAEFPSSYHHRNLPSPVPSSSSPMVSSGPNPQPSASPLNPSSGQKSPPTTQLFPLPSRNPNEDCTMITCSDPFTSTLSGFGHPCGCVRPMQVRLSISISLYSFFPLVSELAREIAISLPVINETQVRVVGANADTQQLEKTTVLINLVPLEDKFNHSIAYLIYKNFWQKQIVMNSSLFGTYDVLYVHYPGLPPSSPPASTSDSAAAATNTHSHSFPVNGYNDGLSTAKPLGVEIPRPQKKSTTTNRRSITAVIILSSVTAFVAFMGIISLIVVYKCRRSIKAQHNIEETSSVSSLIKPSGTTTSKVSESKSKLYSNDDLPPSTTSTCSSHKVLTFTGAAAKVFNLSEIQRATNGFDTSMILGKGGFGVVYRGINLLRDREDHEVAVKVLKRIDRQGGREFMAEVEMLSRLHHRNLVKLIGICQEEEMFRCLVYELVPNGSVESHLHGPDKEIAPLDWETRMNIALGAARGLAYLHEDSDPSVIHCDFKSSNILLDHDFTAKVSDFGLARTAGLNQQTQHISTQMMGTFGYLAPEYAMTGHLLVKSDVYSYGVVLLELLTGRKPVDLTRPKGQENLVTWARPFLLYDNIEGLVEAMIDPSLLMRFGSSDHTTLNDSFYKVAMIASMCVSPEVTRRPGMGEVVQALKLVCDEFGYGGGEVYGKGDIGGSFGTNRWAGFGSEDRGEDSREFMEGFSDNMRESEEVERTSRQYFGSRSLKIERKLGSKGLRRCSSSDGFSRSA